MGLRGKIEDTVRNMRTFIYLCILYGCMNIVAFRTLRAFYEKYPDAAQQLKTWYKEATSANWKSPDEVKKTFGSASIIGDKRVVFNIKGNKYRLIVKFNYKYGWAWIRFIGTHAGYDKINAETI